MASMTLGFPPAGNPDCSTLLISAFRALDFTVIQKLVRMRFGFWTIAVLSRKVWPRVLPPAERLGFPSRLCGLPWLFCPITPTP